MKYNLRVLGERSYTECACECIAREMPAKAAILCLLEQDAGVWSCVLGMPLFYRGINLEWQVCMAVMMAFSERRNLVWQISKPPSLKITDRDERFTSFPSHLNNMGIMCYPVWIVGIQGLQTNSLFPWGAFVAPGAEKGAGTLFNVTWEFSCSAVNWCYSSLMIQKWEKWLGRKKNPNTQEFFPAKTLIHSYFFHLLFFFPPL